MALLNSKPKYSRIRRTASGGDEFFPTLEDILDSLDESERNDINRPDSSFGADAMLAWFRSGQTGCLFAKTMAREPAKHGWQSATVGETLDEEEFHGTLDQITAEPAEAIQIALPLIRSESQLVELINMIGTHPDWSVMILDELKHEDHSIIAIRWNAVGDGKCSWVLGFGPFEFLPFTRRSPVTSLLFRAKPETDPQLPRKFDPIEVHLADMCESLGQTKDERMWLKTELRKKEILNNELVDEAKAKATFLLPNHLVEDLKI